MLAISVGVMSKCVCVCMCGQTGVYGCAPSCRSVSVRGALTLMRANWIETASIQSDTSSLWLQSFWSSLHLSLSLSHSVCLSVSVCAVSFPPSKSRWAVAVMAHNTHPFEFFHLTDPSTTSHPCPHPYLPTRMNACTHSLLYRPRRNSCCVTQWKTPVVMILGCPLSHMHMC